MWQDSASCKDMDSGVFLSGVASRIAIAKAVCATCPVIQECLSFALANEDFEPHVYGGMTGAERKRVALAVA
jgi:WhiB family redox-sensing transcriptional regulator